MQRRKFKTFVADNEDNLNSKIEEWIRSIDGVEMKRTAPAIAISPYNLQGNFGGNISIAVTVTALAEV